MFIAKQFKSVSGMTQDMEVAFTDAAGNMTADFIIAIALDQADETKHEIKVYTATAGPRKLDPVVANMTGWKSTHEAGKPPMPLLPLPNQLLVLLSTDGKLSFCTNRPSYLWF
jgi:hypothetical protein